MAQAQVGDYYIEQDSSGKLIIEYIRNRVVPNARQIRFL